MLYIQNDIYKDSVCTGEKSCMIIHFFKTEVCL